MAQRKTARWLPVSIWIRPASTGQEWDSSATAGRTFTDGWLRMSKGWDYGDWIEGFAKSSLSRYSDLKPWALTEKSEAIVIQMIEQLQNDYSIKDNVAIAHSATVEDAAIIKGPAIIGPQSFIASGAYIRGGCWIQGNNVIGPGCELKSSFLFEQTKVAHLSFVGDSIVGQAVNIEAGAMIANYRNEMTDPKILIKYNGKMIDTGSVKFGALVGDACRIGSNAVIAPGALLDRKSVV